MKTYELLYKKVTSVLPNEHLSHAIAAPSDDEARSKASVFLRNRRPHLKPVELREIRHRTVDFPFTKFD